MRRLCVNILRYSLRPVVNVTEEVWCVGVCFGGSSELTYTADTFVCVGRRDYVWHAI